MNELSPQEPISEKPRPSRRSLKSAVNYGRTLLFRYPNFDHSFGRFMLESLPGTIAGTAILTGAVLSIPEIGHLMHAGDIPIVIPHDAPSTEIPAPLPVPHVDQIIGDAPVPGEAVFGNAPIPTK